MMAFVADGMRALDPRLKLAVALVLGPGLWKMHVASAAVCVVVFLALVPLLAVNRPMGRRMARSVLFFILLWVAVKASVDGATGVPVETIVKDAGQLAVRLAGLVLLGLVLALSTSARTIGQAVAWGIRSLVGRERAWRVALSLALMVHFLPVCLTTLQGVRDMLNRRCPGAGFGMRVRVIPQVVIRVLGQKTWSQTLAVASRGLEGPEAWEPDFCWSGGDTGLACLLVVVLTLFFLF